MLKQLKLWWLRKRLTWATTLVEKHGYVVVKMIHKDGTNYIRANDGSFHRIGRK